MAAIWINVVEDKMQQMFKENDALRNALQSILDRDARRCAEGLPGALPAYVIEESLAALAMGEEGEK